MNNIAFESTLYGKQESMGLNKTVHIYFLPHIK